MARVYLDTLDRVPHKLIVNLTPLPGTLRVAWLRKVYHALFAACLFAAMVPWAAPAQKVSNISTDGSFSPQRTLSPVGGNFSIDANLGKQVIGSNGSSNLFHSFSQFTLVNPDRATFTPTGSTGQINNVIGRVTGGNPSSIDGGIRSTIPGATLYLINPSGIVFGPNATINVNGGFHASTADYVKLSDGTRFQTTKPDNGSTLTAAPPVAFGFLTPKPAAIMVNGSSLSVPAGQTLGLVAGPVSINTAPPAMTTGATLLAPAGTIHITGVAGTGEVPVNPNASSASAPLTVTSFGQVDIKGGSTRPTTLNVSNSSGGGSGGSVFIRAGALTIDAGTINGDNFGSNPAGVISLRGDDQVTLTNSTRVSARSTIVQAIARGGGNGAGVTISTAAGGVISADANSLVQVGVAAGGTGASGALEINAGQLQLSGGAQLSSLTSGSGANGTGKGGSIDITADKVQVEGAAVLARTSAGAVGGSITIAAGELTVDSGASLGTIASSTGKAGDVLVTVAGPVTIDMSVGAKTSLLDGIASATAGTGKAGNVSVTAGTLSITNSGELASYTIAGGDSGDVSVKISGMLSIDGLRGTAGFPTAIFADSLPVPGSRGNAGKVTITAGSLSLMNSGVISSTNGAALTNPAGPRNAGGITVNAGSLTIANNGAIQSNTTGFGNAGSVSVSVDGRIAIDAGQITADSPGGSGSRASANAGGVTVSAGALSIANNGKISSDALVSAGNPGLVTVNAGTLSIGSSGKIESNTSGSGSGGGILVTAGSLTIAGSGKIASTSLGSGRAGNVSVDVTGSQPGALTILTNGSVTASTFGAGDAGSVTVHVGGGLLIDGTGANPSSVTGISSQANPSSTGNAGAVIISAGDLTLVNGGQISSNTFGAGNGGTIGVTAGTLSIASNGAIVSNTFGPRKGGSVSVAVDGQLTIDGTAGTTVGIFANSQAGSTGNAGDVSVTAGTLSIVNHGAISSSALGDLDNLPASTGNAGQVTVSTGSLTIASSGNIATSSLGPGRAGNVSVDVTGSQSGALTILANGVVRSSTFGAGDAGSVGVRVAGGLSIDGAGADPSSLTGISSQANKGSSGNAGEVSVNAGTLSIANNGQISTNTFGSGAAGRVAVTLAGDAALSGGGLITSATSATGNGGAITVSARGSLALNDPGTGIVASASKTAGGDAGLVSVSASQITISSGAQIASTTAGTGAGGSVNVMTPGALVLDGAGVAGTQIAASATGPQSGPGGSVMVGADSLNISGGAQIASTTAGPGKGGDIAVTVANAATLSGSGPSGASAITASAQQGSTGQAGQVVLMAGGAIALSGGAKATSSTAGAGNGGTVEVTAGGPLTLTGFGTGIIASATSTASGNAGSVTVAAPQITITAGGEISSTTAGTGAGGSVNVTTPGALVLNGVGDPSTEIAASAIGPQSGSGGSVIVNAGSLTVEGGAQIASSTAGPGKGGDVDVAVATDIVLPDRGLQISARSTGSGDAGSITVSAVRLLMSNGAAISTEAETSTASGGNITLHVRDFLYLVSSEISTSVKGETGNGGNITIDPQLVILDHSSIIAQAIEGHGGNITITAGEFIPSSDSVVSASSQLGISGTVVINGPRVDVNGALVVLSSQLRGRTDVLREACAARADQPLSSLVEAGRGGLPQDPEATLPALYIAGRDLGPNPRATADTAEPGYTALHTMARLTMRCG